MSVQISIAVQFSPAAAQLVAPECERCLMIAALFKASQKTLQRLKQRVVLTFLSSLM
jgi:hypothetical protein